MYVLYKVNCVAWKQLRSLTKGIKNQFPHLFDAELRLDKYICVHGSIGDFRHLRVCASEGGT